jgi:putative transposase
MFLKRMMKRYGRPRSIVTDRLRPYSAAMKVIGNWERKECARWSNTAQFSSKTILPLWSNGVSLRPEIS